MAQVDLQSVTKVYPGGVRAVDAVDLHIGDREFVVLVGPSGCGKTTTLRMIAGLEEITGGAIRIGERVVNDVPPKDRDIAMVFQNYALYPHMTVYKNMAFGLKLRRMPRDQIHQRVMHAAKTLEIEHLLERKPKALSGGQKQRVAVGRAIVREPAAFLFDEPLSNLDAKLRVTTRAELKRLHQRLRTTTVYVTHDQEEAMTLGDRIVAMKDGRVQQADTPLNTYNKPVNRFVAGFIGMPPMNFFDGALRVVDGQMIFEEGSLGRVGSTNGRPETAVGGSDLNSAAELTLPGNGFRLTIPARLRDALAGRVGQHVVLGVRPEHLHLRPTDQEGAGCPLALKVSVVEPLGSDMDVYTETAAGHRVVARVEAVEEYGSTSGDSEVKMFVDLRKIHLFEPGETGMSLSLTTPREPAHAIA